MATEAANEQRAWPVASGALEQEILDMVQQATHYHQLKKGYVAMQLNDFKSNMLRLIFSRQCQRGH
jgi:hypothetical protein